MRNAVKTCYSYVSAGHYRDHEYRIDIVDLGPLLRKTGRWMISLDGKGCRHAFLWPFFSGDLFSASHSITGFRTLREAKDFDILRYLYRCETRWDAEGKIMCMRVRQHGRDIPFTSNFDLGKLLEASNREDCRFSLLSSKSIESVRSALIHSTRDYF